MTVKYKLRDYQDPAVQIGVTKLITSNAPFILQLATGAGKSIIIAEIAKRLMQPVLVLQPSKELLQQNYDKLMSYDEDIEVGIYSASFNKKEIKQVTYAMIQSIYRHPELFKHFKYVIIDECHDVNPQNLGGMYTKFLSDIGCRKVCGLTATPYRLVNKFDTSELKMVNRIFPFFFKSIAYKVETDELIKKGYLSPITYRAVNLGGEAMLRVNSTGSEYTNESLEKYWEDDYRLKNLCYVIEKIDKHAQRNLIFCASIKQALQSQEMLAAMGIRAELITGATPSAERDALVSAYRRGEFKHMLNVGVFTKGFDVPELDCVILARHTMSLALYYQMVGRGVRLDPARPQKILRVYDLVRLVEKLGRVETIKVVKEDDGFKDKVISEVGEMTNTPLLRFAVSK